MREELLDRALRETQERQEENQLRSQMRRREAEARNPKVRELAAKRESLIRDSVMGILSGRGGQAEELPERMKELSAQIREELVRAGLPENYLEPVVTCAECRDTGYVGETVRVRCKCVERRYQELLRQEIGLPTDGSETFETYDENLLPDEPLEGMSFSQRQMTDAVRKACESWADTYPEQKPRDMVLSGKSGLGKTFLLHAMASRLIERGVPVIVISAWNFLETARKSYFGEAEEIHEIQNSPVLMIDDLGSEPMMQNITIEQLFNLINERQRRNLPTVISTNLSMEELRGRYTERVISRLSDRRNCNFLGLVGQDLRNGRK